VTVTAALTTDLQRQVLLLEDDLRARLQADAEREGQWKQEHQRALEKERTAASWVAWRDDRITQAAVAWVLTSVFIRFCEDNALVSPVWISGPEHRRQEALDAQLSYFRAHPEHTDREWLDSAVNYLASLSATKALVDSHSALYLVTPSGNGVTRLLDFWRTRREDGTLVYDLHNSSLSTRFLGDLYQDLSEHAKDTYALLQTPVFVEEFILDRTLEPALNERPLEGFKLIDPTCGSGHFLLGAFNRLLDCWNRHAPGLEVQARVQAALDSIYGVDLNPFAIAIARFRLTVAALKASGLTSLEKAPAFTFHLAVGDSLIHGPDRNVLPGMSDRSAFMPFTYATEDGPLLLRILEEGTYDVVVGNPPYIAVKDKALNQIYRSKYSNVCRGKYALTVPFMALFFALAKSGDSAGWVGQITSNSFMKREFGSLIIENFLTQRDLRLVADTSGAYIPGHGTPTVILVGRNRSPVGVVVRAVLGVKGEPEQPKEPAKGVVWTSIVDHVDKPGWDDKWISVMDLDRGVFSTHPWSLAGGGAGEVQKRIESASSSRVGQRILGKIGPASFPGADDCFFAPKSALARKDLSNDFIREVITGDVLRDWSVLPNESALVPYRNMTELLELDKSASWYKWLWPNKVVLESIVGFERETRASVGIPWWSWYRWVADRYRTPLSICFAVVATHNHFALARGTGVFNRHAPVIKLPDGSTEDDHLALLTVLNSSTACFWLKQVCHSKGNATASSGIPDQPWSWNVEFNGTNTANYPLPAEVPISLSRALDQLARELTRTTPGNICRTSRVTGLALKDARRQHAQIRAQMVAAQEELDWKVYKLYELIDEDLTYGKDDLPGLVLGERAFEIALARAVQAGEEETAWFTRHGSTQVTEIPTHWPPPYQELVRRRLDLIASDPAMRLLERPEYKRRWAHEPWEKLQERALRDWLLDRLEDRRFWFDAHGRPLPRSVAQLADDVTRDADVVSVLALWEGRPDVPVTQSLVRLLADEAVPYLAAYRYKDSGLRKREAWDETWRLQRREDAGEKVGPIAVPPKYASADFRKNSYWQARGKLDVPKERFILYTDAGRETDPTPLLGWAGWDHAQQSLALLLIIGDREKDGWADDRLVPLVAGLAELQPWVDQWHGEVDPDYGVSLAAFCREQLTARAVQVGKTLDELAAWRPAPTIRGRRSRSAEGAT
jgi:hypothetical protein